VTTSLRRTLNAGLGAALLLLAGGASYWSITAFTGEWVARIAVAGGTLLVIVVVVVAGLRFRHDLLERERADQELRRSRTFLDSIVEQLPHMVFIKDATELRFVRLNRAGEELLGYSSDELVGKSDFDVFPEPEARAFVSSDREALAGGAVVDVPAEEVHTRHKGMRILHTKRVPVLDASGQPRFLLGVSETSRAAPGSAALQGPSPGYSRCWPSVPP
jgi:PAS domain S-box-containing protein